MTDAGFRLEIIRTPESLESLAQDWSALAQAQRDPQLSHAWFSSAAAALHAMRPLRVITLRRGARLVAVAPLVEFRRNGVSRLAIIGNTALYEPSNLLAEDPAALARLCSAIVAEGWPCALMRLPGDGVVSAALAAASRGRGRMLTIGSPCTLRVDLRQGWENYLATRKGEIQTGHARRRRKLEALGLVTFDARNPAPGEVNDILEEAFDVEADSWKGDARKAMRYNLPVQRFVRELSGRYAVAGNLRVSFLRAGGRAVAVNIDVEHDVCLWGIKTGYRAIARRGSPGMLLMRETLHDACKRALRGYEFLGCGDQSQSAWATSSRELQTLLYYPYTPRGIFALTMDVLAHVVSRLWNRLLSRLRPVRPAEPVPKAGVQHP